MLLEDFQRTYRFPIWVCLFGIILVLAAFLPPVKRGSKVVRRLEASLASKDFPHHEVPVNPADLPRTTVTVGIFELSGRFNVSIPSAPEKRLGDSGEHPLEPDYQTYVLHRIGPANERGTTPASPSSPAPQPDSLRLP